MTLAVVGLRLLATATRDDVMRALRSTLQTGPTTRDVLALFFGTLALIGLLILCVRLQNRARRKTVAKAPDYFKLALDQLGLGIEEQRDLRRVAERSGRTHPVSLLLSPANLAKAAEGLLACPDSGALRERLNHLSLKLFGVPVPTSPSIGGSGP